MPIKASTHFDLEPKRSICPGPSKMPGDSEPARNNSLYSKQSYWQDRYHTKDTEQHYEWFRGSYEEFLRFLKGKHQQIFQKDSLILHVGCGDSVLGQDLSLKGSGFVIEVDYAESALQKLFSKRRFAKREGVIADARSPYLRSAIAFDFVLDKGTVDAVFSDGSSPWDPAPSTRASVAGMMRQAHRMLKSPHGMFICMTFGQPHFRLSHMNAISAENGASASWSGSKAFPLGDSFYHIIELEKQ